MTGGRSPLHATRAGVATAWCLALGGAVLAFEHPLILAALGVAVTAAAAGAGVVRPVLRAGLLGALVLGVPIALVNPLVVRDGLTVIARLGELPVLGQLDVTLEALAYGAVLGARATLLIAVAALLAASVQPDELLRLARRLSFRSALTAALATRLVPVLARDGRRLAAAQRCRADAGAPRAGRVAVLRAITTGALDRAVDVAATLELRGYASARRAPRAVAHPWSRHDLAFAAGAAALVGLALAARLAGAGAFAAYPVVRAPIGAAEWLLAAALVATTLLPFADRRGIEA